MMGQSVLAPSDPAGGEPSTATDPAEVSAGAPAPGFAGFAGRGARNTALPDAFFSHVLPDMADIAEMKAFLFAVWRLRGKRGDQQMVTLGELASLPTILRAFGPTDDDAYAQLKFGLEAAARRGILIELIVPVEDRREHVYLLNAPADRERARRLREGRLPLSTRFGRTSRLGLGGRSGAGRASDIHRRWEASLGPITAAIAAQLDRAVAHHGQARVEGAIARAVEAKQPWRYVRAVLRQWENEREGQDGRVVNE